MFRLTLNPVLIKDKSVTIHTKNLHYLITDIHKVKWEVSHVTINTFLKFYENPNYIIRNGSYLKSKYSCAASFWSQSIKNLGEKTLTWPQIKECTSINNSKIRFRKGPTNTCKTCAFLILILHSLLVKVKYNVLFTRYRLSLFAFVHIVVAVLCYYCL